MSHKGQRAPNLYQEGSYIKRRGWTVNVGTPFQSATLNTEAHQPPLPKPPPVPHRHYGDHDDLGPDHLYDPQLLTEEEVCRSYGKVIVIIHFQVS